MSQNEEYYWLCKGFTLFDVITNWRRPQTAAGGVKGELHYVCMSISLSFILGIIPFKPRVNSVVFMEKYVGYRRVVVFYAYSTPTKVAAVVCSGWAVLGRGPQGIVAVQSGLFLLDVSSACRVRCRNECRNECMNVWGTNVFAVLIAFFMYKSLGVWPLCDWSE
jgi:hypothetical protein